MDVAQVAQVVVNYGLPSVLCVILLYLIDKQNDRHSEEIKMLSTTIDNNTKAIDDLSDKLMLVDMVLRLKETGEDKCSKE